MEENPGIRQRFVDPEGETLAGFETQQRNIEYREPGDPAPAPVHERVAPPPPQAEAVPGQVDTYMYLENSTGTLEFDLINFREKGKQIKYFSILLNTVNEQNQLVPTAFSLDEQSFEAVKRFFSQLEWNS